MPGFEQKYACGLLQDVPLHGDTTNPIYCVPYSTARPSGRFLVRMTVTYVHKFLKKKPYRTDIRCKPARRKLVCLCIPTFPAFIVTLEAFSELLEVLYSAPLQQEPWERFLALLTRQTQAEGSFLICASSRQSLSVSAQGGSNILDDVGKLVYKEKFAPSDPFRAPVLRFGRSGVVQDEDLLPNEGLLAWLSADHCGRGAAWSCSCLENEAK